MRVSWSMKPSFYSPKEDNQVSNLLEYLDRNASACDEDPAFKELGKALRKRALEVRTAYAQNNIIKLHWLSKWELAGGNGPLPSELVIELED